MKHHLFFFPTHRHYFQVIDTIPLMTLVEYLIEGWGAAPFGETLSSSGFDSDFCILGKQNSYLWRKPSGFR